MTGPTRLAVLAGISLACTLGCDGRRARAGEAEGGGAGGAARVVIHELLADPRAVPDERGEWVELRNAGDAPVALRGWRLHSGNDRPYTIPDGLVVPPGGLVVLGRDASREANGGVPVAQAWGGALSLANGRDWLALADAAGRTVDSVAWQGTTAGVARGRTLASGAAPDVNGDGWVAQRARFGRGDRGTPGAANDGAVDGAEGRPDGGASAATGSDDVVRGGPPAPASPSAPAAVVRPAPIVVRVLDVGQGDAILIENGGSRVLVDGGPDRARFGRLLDSLGLDDSTFDAVVLTHQHYDHHAGLRELFRTRRQIRVRYFFDNLDAYDNRALAELRDSVGARARRGELVVRDTDDPCADGRPTCTITLRGGARLHVLRPAPAGDANDRSVAIKLVGPDSASFTMWLAGDAERGALAHFDRADYERRPGLDVTVAKAGHHGSCDAITRALLGWTTPEWVIATLATPNDYGYMHEQTKAMLRAARVPWYRTDANGTVTIRSPGTSGGGYTITPSRGTASMDGAMDRVSTQRACRAR